MAQKSVEALAKQLEPYPALRAEFRKDPEGVAHRLGIEHPTGAELNITPKANAAVFWEDRAPRNSCGTWA